MWFRNGQKKEMKSILLKKYTHINLFSNNHVFNNKFTYLKVIFIKKILGQDLRQNDLYNNINLHLPYTTFFLFLHLEKIYLIPCSFNVIFAHWDNTIFIMSFCMLFTAISWFYKFQSLTFNQTLCWQIILSVQWPHKINALKRRRLNYSEMMMVLIFFFALVLLLCKCYIFFGYIITLGINKKKHFPYWGSPIINIFK